ncbi:MAG TPA: hypothetical protein VNA22_01260 [Pyrinomonadaceae bacterium]|nr:hypothetical protein [Pyrinomonadaceae bacterium]
MKRRLSLLVFTVSISLVIATTGIGAGSPATKEVPMKGSGSGQITSFNPGPNGVAITAEGAGEATHLGRFTRTEEILLNPATGALIGSITFVAADGSELTCEFTGNFTGAATAGGTYTWTGGTGRFADASGAAHFSISQSDPANFTFEFTGTIELH